MSLEIESETKKVPQIGLLIFILCSMWLFLSFSPCSAKQLYVTDNIKITLRQDPDTRSTVLDMLQTGTKLERLQSSNGWIKVRTSDGKKGWVLKRYTMSSRPQKHLVEELRAQIQNLQRDQSENVTAFEKIKEKNKSLQKSLNSTRHELKVAQKKYEKLRNNTKKSRALRKNLQNTLNELGITKSRLNKIDEEYKELRSQKSLHWFLYGAGVVIISLIFGFFFGRIQRKKSSRYYF